MRTAPLAALLVLAAPAIAQDAPTPVSAEKKIRRRSGPATGSILGARPVCHTKADWSMIDRRTKADVERSMDRARQMENARTGVSSSGI